MTSDFTMALPVYALFVFNIYILFNNFSGKEIEVEKFKRKAERMYEEVVALKVWKSQSQLLAS